MIVASTTDHYDIEITRYRGRLTLAVNKTAIDLTPYEALRLSHALNQHAALADRFRHDCTDCQAMSDPCSVHARTPRTDG